MGETVTRTRRGEQTGIDDYNNPIYGPDSELDVTGAFVAPGDTSEPAEVGRDAVVADVTVYFPRQWPDIVADDRVTVRGTTFYVIGVPPDWKSPYGTALGGLVVRLRKVAG